MDTTMEAGTSSDRNSATEFSLELIPGTEILSLHNAWEEAEPLIEAAHDVWDSLYTLEWIRENVMLGNLHLWMIRDVRGKLMSVVLSHIAVYPKQRVLVVMLAAGKGLVKYLKAHISAIQVIEQLAANKGITKIMIKGRKGWTPVLRKLGYEVAHTEYTRELTVEGVQ